MKKTMIGMSVLIFISSNAMAGTKNITFMNGSAIDTYNLVLQNTKGEKQQIYLAANQNFNRYCRPEPILPGATGYTKASKNFNLDDLSSVYVQAIDGQINIPVQSVRQNTDPGFIACIVGKKGRTVCSYEPTEDAAKKFMCDNNNG